MNSGLPLEVNWRRAFPASGVSDRFVEEGYLFLPDCFSEEEVAILREEAEQIYATNRQEVWCEKTGAPRTAFAAHTYNEAFRLLGSHCG
jgi:ectoine hydroxylase